MMRLEQQAQRLIENSYYVDSAHAAPRHAPLQGEVQTDVCIVGGGLAGLSAALELRKRGMRGGVARRATHRLGRFGP